MRYSVRSVTILILVAQSILGYAWVHAGDKDRLHAKLKSMSPREQLEYLESLKEEAPRDPKIPFYMGNAMYALGKLDSAVTYFEKAVAIDSTFYKAYVNMGIALDGLRRRFGAESAFKKALAVKPDDPLARCHLGFLYYSRKEYGRAMEQFRKALAIDPENAQAHYYMGLAFAEAHIFKEALKEWETVAKLDPEGELGKNARENVKLIKQYMSTKVR